LATTNDTGNYFGVLSNLNNGLGPWYRYESGTSMSAPAVSGMLALMQDFFTNQWHFRPSPALLKALLINGARPVNTLYDLQVNTTINYQGWGLANLTNSLPLGMKTNVGQAASMLLVDQDPVKALATGDRRTFTISVPSTARSVPLRVTLVWTDPPGNPAASVKLVNNLDLVVTNRDDESVYFGNDIQAGNNFNQPWDSEAEPNLDGVNNVENIYLSPPLDSQYSITVVGRSVNVNAVAVRTNEVVQDFALVISSGNGLLTNALTITNDTGVISASVQNATVLTNSFAEITTNLYGQFLYGQTVGAINANPFLPAFNQWRFYLITNTMGFSNAAFATFSPLSLSMTRMSLTNSATTAFEPDIDLYISTDSSLTNLNSSAIAGALKSTGRGGTESVVLTNATASTYYVGVKSEDRQGASFRMMAAFTPTPTAVQDSSGAWVIRGINAPANIPDGTPALPGGVQVMAFAPASLKIRHVVVTNTLSHENAGDLLGNLSHNEQWSVLHNHTYGTGALIYDDDGNTAGSRHVDGPGSLNDFIGTDGVGQWQLTEVDNALSHVGRVENLTIRLEPKLANNVLPVQPYQSVSDYVYVPPQGTNLIITVTNISANPLPVQLYVKFEAVPSSTDYDYTKTINPPGGVLSIGLKDLPPLKSGTYHIIVYNPNAIPQTIVLNETVQTNLNPIIPQAFTAHTQIPLVNHAVTFSALTITNDQRIVSAAVGVALNYPRMSDLGLTLISPFGQRYSLFANRGGTNAANLGAEIVTGGVTNVLYTVFTEDTNVTTTPIKFAVPPFTPGSSNVYYLPEISLGRLIGKNAAGTWQLEIENDGSTTNAPRLISWQLQFILQTNTSEPVALTHGLSENNSIPAGGILYYTVDVPSWASFATNSLLSASGPVNVYFDQTTPPTGTNAGDFTLFSNATSGSATLSTSGTPALVPGSRYYLAVKNPNATNVTVSVEIDFNLTALTNGVSCNGTLPPNLIPRYFSYDVSSTATAVSFQLSNLTGNLNLIARKGAPLPTFDSYDYGSFNLGTNDESIIVFSNSNPIALSPGRWYLGVYNADGQTNNFTMLVTEYTNLFGNIIDLSYGYPHSATNSGPMGAADYYRYTVSGSAARVQFQLNNLNGDMALLAHKGLPLPSLSVYDYMSDHPGTNDEWIVIVTGSAPVSLTPGDWFLTVLNLSSSSVSYSLTATEWNSTGRPFTMSAPQFSRVGTTNIFGITWNSLPGVSYYIEGNTDLANTNWLIVSPTILASDYTSTYSVALPSPPPYCFFRVIEGQVLNDNDFGAALAELGGRFSTALGFRSSATTSDSTASSVTEAEDWYLIRDVLLQMMDEITPTPGSDTPITGTFYSAQYPDWPPLPGNFLQIPAWNISDNIWLLDDRQVDYSALGSHRTSNPPIQ
jgi:subtilisin-like proprotein convertase family protein